MGPKKKGDKKGKKEEEPAEVSGMFFHIGHYAAVDDYVIQSIIPYPNLEYDTMDLEMLREVVPMLRQQLEKSMLDRNYVQLERVRTN
jgi:hypothetical protein